MRLRVFLLVSLIAAQGVFAGALAAGGESAAPDTARQFGLVFDFQAAPNLSSLRAYRDGGFMVSLGVGVNIAPKFLVTLNVYTGSEHIPDGPDKPASGSLDLGGAAVEATYFFTEGKEMRPYVAGGYGLFTDLVSEGSAGGYSGGGPYLEIGVEWECSRYLSLRGGAQYAALYFHNPVGGAASSSLFRAFTEGLLGGALRISFYPSISP